MGWETNSRSHQETGEDDIRQAHAFCGGHRAQLLQDERCGCFYCLHIFSPIEITDWIDTDGVTALCPHCGIDAVIGESSGYPVTAEFLRQMRRYWFEEA